ncbi:hypothetical protein N6H13_02625 [Paenibacillus sp. CC-CFT742]|nr:hypothetical protein [Paenibacillus sp. CC-CFT742]WJH29693.1 hypothetical protein N6H13_02625 [Paenibacillus sp. CC-CFT742]
MSQFKIYRSTGEHELFKPVSEEQLNLLQSNREPIEVKLDDQHTFQEMDGFGASFTDSSAYLIHQILSEEQREKLMIRLFHPQDGIGLSVIRNPMGASDYARTVYSYNDLPEGETDPDLVRFSIAHDEEDVIPLTRKAIELNPDLKLFLSPWSAPGWMKTSGSMITGQLKHEYYPVYAEYFAKTIKAYGEHGLPVHAVTPQNEALYEPGHYPGMLMPAEAQADFIKNHLKPAFVSQGIQTKILCYDHNWDEPGYPLTVLEQAGEDVDGVAWHWYGVKHRHKQRCIKRMLERKYILQKDQEGNGFHRSNKPSQMSCEREFKYYATTASLLYFGIWRLMKTMGRQFRALVAVLAGESCR